MGGTMNVAFLDGYWNFFLHEYFFSSHKHNNFCEIYIYIFIKRSTLLFPYGGNLLQCKLFRNRVIVRLQAR